MWSLWYVTTEVKCDVNSIRSAIVGFEDWVKEQKMWVPQEAEKDKDSPQKNTKNEWSPSYTFF